MDSPGSPLSDISSDAESVKYDAEENVSRNPVSPSPEPEVRPNKRLRLSESGRAAARRSSAVHTNGDNASVLGDDTLTHGAIAGLPSDVDISSDTDGSVPGSPHLPGTVAFDDDDPAAMGGKEQITICRWDFCEAGDQGNMDLLVKHLHDEHIHARQKKYSCEWSDCPRKGIAHASGYALRAHMRSHTREKPFYCTLPECDRSFTRSDALAKHMRTVHETEALRPSDPVPKHHSSNPQNNKQRLRLTFKVSGKDDDGKSSRKNSPGSTAVLSPLDTEYEHTHATFSRDPASGKWIPHFPSDIHFTKEELELEPERLYWLLRRQLRWATEEGEELASELSGVETRKKSEWMAKELVLSDLIEKEKSTVPSVEELIKLSQTKHTKKTVVQPPAETEDVELPDADAEEADNQDEKETSQTNGDVKATTEAELPPLPWSDTNPATAADEKPKAQTNGITAS